MAAGMILGHKYLMSHDKHEMKTEESKTVPNKKDESKDAPIKTDEGNKNHSEDHKHTH
ncbi:hypothetical protein [Leptospira vanthielii]|nr:hypothetical protein [Leptospira vanthielii]